MPVQWIKKTTEDIHYSNERDRPGTPGDFLLLKKVLASQSFAGNAFKKPRIVSSWVHSIHLIKSAHWHGKVCQMSACSMALCLKRELECKRVWFGVCHRILLVRCVRNYWASLEFKQVLTQFCVVEWLGPELISLCICLCLPALSLCRCRPFPSPCRHWRTSALPLEGCQWCHPRRCPVVQSHCRNRNQSEKRHTHATLILTQFSKLLDWHMYICLHFMNSKALTTFLFDISLNVDWIWWFADDLEMIWSWLL